MQILEKLYKKHLTILCLTSIMLLCSSVAQAEFRHWNDWTKKEQALFGAYNTLQYIDLMQTRRALTHPCDCYGEANPIFGDNPHPDRLYLISALATSVIYWHVGASSPNDANTDLLIISGIRLGTIIRNDRIGISWRVAF